MLSLPWVWNHPNMEGWTCFTWIVFDQFVLALKTQPTWLRENHWMNMLIICGTAYLRKGNTYGTKYKFLIAMLNLCATFMISLVVLKYIVNTFLSSMSLMNEILSSYAKGVYEYFDVENIEEFVAFTGACEIASLIEKYYDTIHKTENFAVLAYCFENYVCNDYIEEFKNKMFASQEEANDCYDEESYDSEDSLDTSLSDKLDTCFVDGHDATMNDAYGDELPMVPYVKNEIVAIAPTLDCHIILFKSPTHNCTFLAIAFYYKNWTPHLLY